MQCRKNKLKPKKCRMCQFSFNPHNSLQIVCSPGCAIKKAKADQAKKENKKTREKKKGLKTRAKWLKEAQIEFNKYIRKRDERIPCISCGRYHEGQFHAGHYLTVKARPELRFHPFNCNKQCRPCNEFLSGNIVLYRKNLIEKIGLENVEWLEGPHELQRLTIDDIKEIKDHYKQNGKAITK